MASVKYKVWESAMADYAKALEDDKLLLAWLYAHNRYQEDMCDGVDYVFSLSRQEDLVCCVEGGLTAADIVGLFAENTGTDYFLFGQNYPRPKRITREQLRNFVYSRYECILCEVMRYPYIEEYKKLYKLYVLPNLL